MALFIDEAHDLSGHLKLRNDYFGFMASQYFILNWMPRLMVDAGYTDAGAISFSIITNIGAIIGCAVIGIFTAKWGLQLVTMTTMVIMAAAIAAFGTLPLGAVGLIRTSSFFIGFAAFAMFVGAFSIMASGFPPHVRGTRIGLSFTAGRFGTAAGAYLGGVLLAMGLERPELCVVLALPAIGAGSSPSGTLALPRLWGNRYRPNPREVLPNDQLAKQRHYDVNHGLTAGRQPSINCLAVLRSRVSYPSVKRP